MSVIDVTAGLAVVILGAAALGALWRIVSGPSILDRILASEVLLVLVVASLLAEMAYHRHTTNLPVVLAVAVLSFTGSVSVARYVSSRPRDDA